MYKIYCAGPLFNAKEKEEMAAIAAVLETHGFAVFLPHRDGFEFAGLNLELNRMGLSPAQATGILNTAIFSLDVYQVLDSDGLVLNINGRVPDEGSMVEAGIAWQAGKKIVIYKSDVRSLLNGHDNPLLAGLSGFTLISDIGDLPGSFNACFNKVQVDNVAAQMIFDRGRALAAIAAKAVDKEKVCKELLNLIGESHVQSI